MISRISDSGERKLPDTPSMEMCIRDRIETVVGSSPEDINAKIDKMIRYCNGTSRDGSNGASAKLQFAKEALSMGTTVMIAHARHRLRDIMSGKIPCTVLRVE